MNYIIRVKEAPGETLSGRYIHGPSTPAEVKQRGYHFGAEREKAWPFPTEKQAANKARIVERHMSMPAGWMEVLVEPDLTKCCNAPEILVRGHIGCLDFHEAPYEHDKALLAELEAKHSVSQDSEFWLDDSICVMTHCCAACRKPTTKPWIEHG